MSDFSDTNQTPSTLPTPREPATPPKPAAPPKPTTKPPPPPTSAAATPVAPAAEPAAATAATPAAAAAGATGSTLKNLPKPPVIGTSARMIAWQHADHSWAWIVLFAPVGYLLRQFTQLFSAFCKTGSPFYASSLPNIIGSIIAGYLHSIRTFYPQNKWLLGGLLGGLCGSITTFSSWIHDAMVIVTSGTNTTNELMSLFMCIFTGASHGILGVRLGGLLGGIVGHFLPHPTVDEVGTPVVQLTKVEGETVGQYNARMKEIRARQRTLNKEKRTAIKREITAAKKLRKDQLNAWQKGKGRYLTADEVVQRQVQPADRTPPPEAPFTLHLTIIGSAAVAVAGLLIAAYAAGWNWYEVVLPKDKALFTLLLGSVLAVLGACLRRALVFMNQPGLVLPWGTLIANLGASVLYAVFDKIPEASLPAWVKAAVQGGFCGALSTLSSWAIELTVLGDFAAAVYFVASVGGAMALIAVVTALM